MRKKTVGFATVISLLTLPGFTAPDIAVTDVTDVLIPDGSTQTSSRAGTDLGHAALANGERYKTFSIYNVGDVPLVLNVDVGISGPNAADFTLNVPPTSPINLNTAFSIKFDPSAVGVRTATVTINSNDPDEGVYTFAISGTGGGFPLAGPNISVLVPLDPKTKALQGGNIRVSGKFQYQNLGPLAMNAGLAQVYLSEDRVLDPQDPMILQTDLKAMPPPVGDKIKTKKKKFKGVVPFDGDGGFVFVRILPLPLSVNDVDWANNVTVHLYNLPL